MIGVVEQYGACATLASNTLSVILDSTFYMTSVSPCIFIDKSVLCDVALKAQSSPLLQS